jgi:hypothetical protein
MVALFTTITLHDSDFINRMKPIKLTLLKILDKVLHSIFQNLLNYGHQGHRALETHKDKPTKALSPLLQVKSNIFAFTEKEKSLASTEKRHSISDLS